MTLCGVDIFVLRLKGFMQNETLDLRICIVGSTYTALNWLTSSTEYCVNVDLGVSEDLCQQEREAGFV